MVKPSQNRRWVLIISIIALMVVIIFVGGYLVWKGDRETALTEKKATPTTLPRMANLPPKENGPIPPEPKYPADAPALEQARKALREGIGPAEAVALANSLPESPERADAVFLLLEYAAETGNPEAAMAVGQYYDPSYEGPSGTIRKNPMTAHEWYREALAGGHKEANNHLAKLRHWVKEQAE